jgi:protein involved in polysaccharide export with SLBB domain
MALPLSSSEATSRPRIYIWHEVKSPGVYSWSGGMTLTDAIISTGGFTDFAGRDRIRVSHNYRSPVQVYDFDRILKHKAQDPVLEPGDFILVGGSITY